MVFKLKYVSHLIVRLLTYSILKHNFEFEKYLDVHMNRKYKIY